MRIDPETLTRIREAAELDGKSVGVFIKEAAASAAERRIQQAEDGIEFGGAEDVEGTGKPGMMARVFGLRRRSRT